MIERNGGIAEYTEYSKIQNTWNILKHGFIDQMVTQDCHRGRRNLSMAWVDVTKAYDSVDHEWLSEMMSINRFPRWLSRVVTKLSKAWNTRIVTRTKLGVKIAETIQFRRGLPQGDSLCPRLFTICLNTIAWKLKATEGYRLSKPIDTKVTHLLYIDDLKIFAASAPKLNTVMKSARSAMQDIGLDWNPKKCSVVHIKRGVKVQDAESLAFDEASVIKCLEEGAQYKFLGLLSSTIQEDQIAFKLAAEMYLNRMSIIWSSPLSDFNRIVASNQYALPALTYLMWTQHLPITELQRIDREMRKIVVEQGGKHPLGSTALCHLTRQSGGRGLRSVEAEYKAIQPQPVQK